MYLVLFADETGERAHSVIEAAHPLLRKTLQALANQHRYTVIARRLLGPHRTEELKFEPQR